ncbi:hypothetical protein GNF80_16125 [Clostridium perfringens]|nr:hypothetical protein [Clostridium perfringens]
MCEKDVKKDAEKKYEFKFYRYLGLVLIILFSCIVTVSNLINSEETRKVIAEIVRNDYSEFFQYEIYNNDKGLENIYDDYSKENNISVERLIALNTIYFGQDESRYLKPYMKSYINKYNLSEEDRGNLYKQVNREIKVIENKYTFKLIIKRFSPYVLAIIFVTIIMGSSSFIRKRTRGEKKVINILVFLIGTYMCYLSLINVKYGILINIAIIGALLEFIIENRSKVLNYVGGTVVICIAFASLFVKFHNKNINLNKYSNDNLVLVNNLHENSNIENGQDVKKIDRSLFSEMKKQNLVEVNEPEDQVNKLIEEKNKLILKDKATDKPILYIFLYNEIPIYRIVSFEDTNSIKVYEGVLNPYMRSTLMKSQKGKSYRKKKSE